MRSSSLYFAFFSQFGQITPFFCLNQACILDYMNTCIAKNYEAKYVTKKISSITGKR